MVLMARQDHIFETTDGNFHYIDWGGSGPLTHFSHATGLCAGTYSPLAERLTSHMRILGMDDRGHGQTRAPADLRKLKNWDGFVDDLESFFEYLGEPVIAMGHSLGATVSLLLAVKRPELIRALVLIDPTILPLSWMWWWYLAKKTGTARRFKSKVPSANMVPLEGTGHFVPMDRPDDTAAIIIQFLNDQDII